MSESVPLNASSEMLDFLRTAKTRAVTKAPGLIVAPNRAGQMVLAATPFAKPGEYTVTISGTSASGEQRQTNVNVRVNAMTTVPIGSARNPVVLLNGWEEGYTNDCPISTSSADVFGNLADYLVADGVPVVYFFDNCLIDPNNTIEQLGLDLGAYLNTIQYPNGQQVPQIDLVAFSLGGLIVRSYLAGLQPNTEALVPPTPTLAANVVFLATPHFGSFVAGNNSFVFTTGTQSAELIPGSSLLWNLANWNQRSDDLRGVNAIAVVGNAGTYTSPTSATTLLGNASDGLVSLTSASLGFVTQNPNVTRIVPYCQVDPVTFTTTLFGAYACNSPGIANITSEAHPTSEIVRSFLAGTTAWESIGTTPATDPYLSVNGAAYFSLVNVSGGYAMDLTQVAWGNVAMVNGGDANTVFYDDFVAGNGVFEASSASLGTVNCGSYAQALGYSSAIRCKQDATIESIGPLLTTFPKVVGTGTITINGNDLGSQCNGCRVTALQATAAAAVTLQVTSWKNNAITAVLPASFTGLSIITVNAASGTDAMAIVAGLPNPSIIAAAPASLAFSYTLGGSAPASQSISVTNTGAGTLSYTVTAGASWLSVSPSSGTAPSTLTVSVSTAGLAPGTYTSSIQITASGASNSPVSVPVALTVAQPPPVVTAVPQALTFNYAVGGPVPSAQTVAITNTGGGTLTWTATSSVYWVSVSPASGTAPSSLAVSINPANLAAGTYSTNVPVNSVPIAVTLVVTGTLAAPAITSVDNGADFQPGVASATWIAIFGSNLSSSTYTWQASDFVNGVLPTSLQGVSVTINGVPAYVEYISPTQINVLAPDDTSIGQVPVQVTVAQQTSNALAVQKNQFSPAFFASGTSVIALHLNYSLVTSTSPAQPGETIILYGTGFGPTNPVSPTIQLVATPASLANAVQISIGGTNATASFAGLVSSGLYQFNVTVPTQASGSAAVVATIEGISTQSGLSLAVAVAN